MVPEDFQAEFFLANALQEWQRELQPRRRRDLPRPEVTLSMRWYPGLPEELERQIIELDVIQSKLDRGRERSSLQNHILVAGSA